MREVKFRYWDMIHKNFITDCEVYFVAEDYILAGDVGNPPLIDVSGHVQVSQYTGLKDKNGREIYDGDVIYWEIDNGVGIESYSAVVQWSENLVEEGWNQTYKWLVGYTGDYYRGSYDELSTPAAYKDGLQVIANIYENPELIKGVSK